MIFDEKINAGAKSEDSETCTASKQETDSSDNTEWRTFLAEYEAWIDRYVELTGKIKENPQDIFLLADQTAMLLEMSCLKEKSGKFEKNMESSEFSEYITEFLRILEKMKDISF